jgi:phytoene dehydrogenase-like protein
MNVLIIGGGVAGLSAAIHLHRQGHTPLVLEASDRVGGRIKTDVVDGFRLDRGFQVLLTAYPEAQALLDYSALDLRSFQPGALLLNADGSISAIGDPIRQPALLFSTLFSSAGNLSDKLALLRLRTNVMHTSAQELLSAPETPTENALAAAGIGTRLRTTFFEPFFSGIFLDTLATSSRMFNFVFKMFSEGHAAVPALGMEEIPRQLAAQLPAEAIRCNTQVAEIQGNTVVLSDGPPLAADQIVLAVNASSPLVQQYVPATPRSTQRQGTTCLYFAAPQSPSTKNMLLLANAPGRLVNHVAVMSDIAPAYAPDGQALISVTLANGRHAESPGAVLAELSRYFATDTWRHLRTYTLPEALPNQHQIVPTYAPRLGPHLVYAGDFALYSSLNAALASGRMAASAALAAQPN